MYLRTDHVSLWYQINIAMLMHVISIAMMVDIVILQDLP